MTPSFDASPIIHLVTSDKSAQEIISALSAIPDDSLRRIGSDVPSGNIAPLIFYIVQNPNDEEARQVLDYLCCQRQVCDVKVTDYNWQTALFFAARDGNAKCVKFLADHGCDPNHKDSADQTALFYACREGRTNIAKILIENFNAEINAHDKVGQTALFYAARDGKLDTVKYMLSQGADASVRDWQKKTAHSYAQKKGHYELAAFLKTASGAVESGSQSRVKKKTALTVDHRTKYRLQYQLTLSDGTGMWLFADAAKIEEFEKEFGSLSVWSRVPAKDFHEPTDSFRIEWAKEALQVVETVSNFQDGWLFRKPVDTKTWGCPDYYSVIHEPRDFSMIRRKLNNLEYLSIQTFVRDMELVFSNCFKYNPAQSDVHKAGKRVEAFCRTVFEERNIDAWINKEKLLIEFLQEHQMPVHIGPEAEKTTAEVSEQPNSS